MPQKLLVLLLLFSPINVVVAKNELPRFRGFLTTDEIFFDNRTHTNHESEIDCEGL